MNWIGKEIKKEKDEFNLLKDRRKPKVVYKTEHQTGTSNKKRDKARKSLPPGKRISKSGKIYWESRVNRSDLTGSNI